MARTLLLVVSVLDERDDFFSYVVRWVRDFATTFDQVTVIASRVGVHHLPAAVNVHSLGKEDGIPKWKRIWRYLVLFSREYVKADVTLFFASPEFVLASSPFLLARRRITALWYVHRHVGVKLLAAERFVDYIFTAGESGFRIPSKKIVYVGHAVDTDLFVPSEASRESGQDPVRLLVVGRIAPIKNLEIIIHACDFLRRSHEFLWRLSFVGSPSVPRDYDYLRALKNLVSEKDLTKEITFEGSRSYREMPAVYQNNDLFISMAASGSFDKAVLEAMASGLSVITASAVFSEFLPARYVLEAESPELLAERVKLLAREERPNRMLRDIVVREHGLGRAIERMSQTLQNPL